MCLARLIKRILRMKESEGANRLYNRYEITLDFEGGMGIAGGTPLTVGLIAQHIRLQMLGVSNPLKASEINEGQITPEAMEEYLQRCSSGFMADENGIYLRGFQFNAMLKDAAQRMKETVKKKGLGNTIRDGGTLFPPKIYLSVDPVIIERPVKPDYGPSNIKVFQVAEPTSLTIPCAVLDNGDLHEALFRSIWIVAQGIGIGANRHLGYGQFNVASIRRTEDWDITKLWKKNGELKGGSSPVPPSSGLPASEPEIDIDDAAAAA